MINENIKIDEIEKIKEMLNRISIDIEYKGSEQIALLNGENVSGKIREKEVSSLVSPVSAIPEVRKAMTNVQRKIAKSKMEEGENVVIEGRDIGTYVFPDADLKLYFDADVNVRATRRMRQLEENGIKMNYEDVLKNIIDRDTRDSMRKIAPLKKAEDAIIIDATYMSVETMKEEVKKIIIEKMKKNNWVKLEETKKSW